jgi:hypothetical protein
VRIVEHATGILKTNAFMFALILEILFRIPVASGACHRVNTAPQYHVKSGVWARPVIDSLVATSEGGMARELLFRPD